MNSCLTIYSATLIGLTFYDCNFMSLIFKDVLDLLLKGHNSNHDFMVALHIDAEEKCYRLFISYPTFVNTAVENQMYLSLDTYI